MVIFQTPDGNPGYNQFETIDEAVRFVEVLRNEQGVENARMFALEEVKFDFKPYFRVEIDPPMLSPAPSRPAQGGNGVTMTAPENRAPLTEPPVNGFRPTGDSPSAAAPPPPPAAPQAAAPSPSQPTSEGSPVGGEAPVSTVPPPTFMAGTPESEEEQPATTRRGLFGR
jgi:hypothetical protein